MFEEKIASSDQHLIHRHNSAAETPLSHPLLLLIWCYYLTYIVSQTVLVAFTLRIHNTEGLPSKTSHYRGAGGNHQSGQMQ